MICVTERGRSINSADRKMQQRRDRRTGEIRLRHCPCTVETSLVVGTSPHRSAALLGNSSTSRGTWVALPVSMLIVARAILLAGVATTLSASYSRVVGSSRTYEVTPGDTLSSIGARAGIEPRTLARDNNINSDLPLIPGDGLVIDNRHIAPDGYTDGLVVNVPQRMLFVFSNGEPIRAFPIAVGRATWRTPLGTFAISSKETDPVWEVPVSIQREMARVGKHVLTRVDAGDDNPLGRHWLGLTLPGVGIHGTNQPASIFHFTTHGCIRMRPDDIAALFELVEIGTPVRLIYEPLLVAADAGAVFVEVHPDVYGRIGSPAARMADLLRQYGVDHLVTEAAVVRAVADRAGRAVVVSVQPGS
jgi:L,D-transpeptidase ErfK/SrfK